MSASKRNTFKSDPEYTRKTTGKDTRKARDITRARKTVRTLKYAATDDREFTITSDDTDR